MNEVVWIVLVAVLGLLCLHVWIRTVLIMYFNMRRRHNINMVKELKEESRSWQDD